MRFKAAGLGVSSVRRFRWIVAVLGGCVVLMVGAFGVGALVASPHEAAVANSKVRPVVTAVVEERTVQAAQTEAEGTVALGRTWSVYASGTEGALAVVTATPRHAGDRVVSGAVLAMVSGRPLIGLELPFDLYRDLGAGDSGDDVRAVQGALGSMGLYRGRVDGHYGAGTAAAVRALYARAGVSVPKAETGDGEAPVDATGENSGGASGGSGAGDGQAGKNAAGGGDARAGGAGDGGAGSGSGGQQARLTPLPRAEVVSLPGPSAQVVAVAPVNTHLDSETAAVQLRSGATTVTARVGVGDKAAFAMGAKVSVQASSDGNLRASGTVTAVSEFRQMDPEKNASIPGHDVTVTLASPGGFDDQQQVSVAVESTADARTGPGVPVTALRQDARTTYVLVPDSDGGQRRVEVGVGVIADGWALVTDTSLTTGDEVIVATDR